MAETRSNHCLSGQKSGDSSSDVVVKHWCECYAFPNQHATTVCNKVVCALMDIKSTNGVFLNHERIKSGVAMRLVPNDVIGKSILSQIITRLGTSVGV